MLGLQGGQPAGSPGSGEVAEGIGVIDSQSISMATSGGASFSVPLVDCTRVTVLSMINS
jgi:hypothetical protein